MALLDCREPVFDRQVNQILQLLEEGIDRAEIAEKLGYSNPMSLDNYMRRRNFSWDSRQKNFVPAAERYSGKGQDNLLQLHGTSKAALIISLFDQGESDPKDIARQAGIDSYKEMANYMKKKGYEWDVAKGNYVKMSKDKLQANQTDGNLAQLSSNAAVAEALQNIIPFLKNIQNMENPQVQSQVNIEEAQNIPRYKVKGQYTTKGMRMAIAIDELTRRYSLERNISQREILEVALIEFFKRYGYRDEIENYLND